MALPPLWRMRRPLAASATRRRWPRCRRRAPPKVEVMEIKPGSQLSVTDHEPIGHETLKNLK
jgi:hypothetical protein